MVEEAVYVYGAQFCCELKSSEKINSLKKSVNPSLTSLVSYIRDNHC